MNSSASSSSPSPSPPSSPEASFHGPPSLERLVLHLVSAKRALTSTQHVHRANELITSSRSLIEEIAVLNAKNGYVRRGVNEQVETLEAIRNGINNAGEQEELAFKQTIARLDVANDRLTTTLGGLKKVLIAPSLQQSSQSLLNAPDTRGSSLDASDSPAQQTLFDFIDEGNHKEVLASLHELIDSYRDSEHDLENNVSRLSEAITHVTDTLPDQATISDPPSRPAVYDEPPSSISAIFHDMEGHAEDMAGSLQSLISHYDACVSALKHTEGGSEAARLALQSDESAKDTSGDDAEESLDRTTVPGPMDDAERAEMLRILESDAVEVDDVAAEIRDRASDMESLYARLSDRAGAARNNKDQLRRAFSSLSDIKATLPIYLDALKVFRTSWTSVQLSIATKTEELVGFCRFYEQFHAGYKKLLREIDRRKAAAEQMRAVATKARRDLDRLYKADQVARDTFMEDVGVFLPGDLAPGLARAGMRWEITENSATSGSEHAEQLGSNYD